MTVDYPYPPEFGRRKESVPTDAELRTEWRAMVAKRVAVLLLVLTLALTLATALVVALMMRQSQADFVPLVEETNRIGKRIEDCTTPGRKCYDRGQRQLAGAVADVNELAIIASACASGPQVRPVVEIEACVLREIAARE